ncbi:hypothetical protein EVAR_64960_1 [Eumeta japonica]|uniref:Uncharacterized protein n=1 Tax=Eumeta variegata TaxID=151549 RepID=A0A4C1ZJ47_EUMVA|nr:hypothetical protein EVAR_64960_1 [Eumeta japonica]
MPRSEIHSKDLSEVRVSDDFTPAVLRRVLSLSSSTRLGPRSQSLFRSYGSNLPTSLHYSIDQGSSPRRPAADMNSAELERSIEEKLFPNLRRRLQARSGHPVEHSHLLGERTITETLPLPGSTDSCNYCLRETLLHVGPPGPHRVLLLPPRSAPTEAPGGLTPRPFCALRRARPTRYGLMADIGRPPHVPVSCLHSLADTNLHGHRPDVLNVQPLLGNCERLLGALTLRSVHPAAPVLLTKIGPLGTVIESRASIFKQAGVLTHLEFEKKSLRSSITVSRDFDLTRHRSPSSGPSICAHSTSTSANWERTPRKCGRGRSSAIILPGAPLETPLHFRFAFQLQNSMTRTHARLLGPCFKTGPAECPKRNRRRPRHAPSDVARQAQTRACSAIVRAKADYGTTTAVGPNASKARARIVVYHSLPTVTNAGPTTPDAIGYDSSLVGYGVGRNVLLREKCTPPTHFCGGPVLNLSVPSFEFRRFTPERFHVLLNSLFKVLFNFPSRYSFAIGLAVIFSLRWSLPPAWGCTLKRPDSKESPSRRRAPSLRAWHPLRESGPVQEELGQETRRRESGTSRTPHVARPRVILPDLRPAIGCVGRLVYPSARRKRATEFPLTAISKLYILRASFQSFHRLHRPLTTCRLRRDDQKSRVIIPTERLIFKRTTPSPSPPKGSEEATRVETVNGRTPYCWKAFAVWPLLVYGQPSDRSGPGRVSADRNLRSKCRCSSVSCSSHYDAQLAAFFIDPRAE